MATTPANVATVTLRPTRRLREALLIAAVVAARDGRRAISTSDLHEAVSAPVRPRREWRRPRGAPLDAAARRLWTRAEAEAELLAHPYLAPEHIALVGAGEADRARLLAALGTPFAYLDGWDRNLGAQRLYERHGFETIGKNECRVDGELLG